MNLKSQIVIIFSLIVANSAILNSSSSNNNDDNVIADFQMKDGDKTTIPKAAALTSNPLDRAALAVGRAESVLAVQRERAAHFSDMAQSAHAAAFAAAANHAELSGALFSARRMRRRMEEHAAAAQALYDVSRGLALDCAAMEKTLSGLESEAARTARKTQADARMSALRQEEALAGLAEGRQNANNLAHLATFNHNNHNNPGETAVEEEEFIYSEEEIIEGNGENPGELNYEDYEFDPIKNGDTKFRRNPALVRDHHHVDEPFPYLSRERRKTFSGEKKTLEFKEGKNRLYEEFTDKKEELDGSLIRRVHQSFKPSQKIHESQRLNYEVIVKKPEHLHSATNLDSFFDTLNPYFTMKMNKAAVEKH